MTTQVTRRLEHLLLWSKVSDSGLIHPFLSIGCNCHQEQHPCPGDNRADVDQHLTSLWWAIPAQRPGRPWWGFHLQQLLALPGRQKLLHTERSPCLAWVAIVVTHSVKSHPSNTSTGLGSSWLSARITGQNFSSKSWSSDVYNYRQWGSKSQAHGSLVFYFWFCFH